MPYLGLQGQPPPVHCNATGGNERDRDHEAGERRLSHPLSAGVITLSHSASANGLWTTLARPLLRPRPDKWDYFVTNPSVHIFAQGAWLRRSHDAVLVRVGHVLPDDAAVVKCQAAGEDGGGLDFDGRFGRDVEVVHCVGP